MNPSDIKKILPQSSLALCGRNEMRQSAVLALAYLHAGEYQFIFEKRAKGVPQSGEICFPGGMISSEDEDSQSAAIRETTEELGISSDKIHSICPVCSVVAPMGAIVDAYFAVAEITSLDDCTIDTFETEEVFSIPVSFFENNPPEEYEAILKVEPFEIDKTGKTKTLFPSKALGLPERYHSTWGNARHKIFVYKYNDEIIWGITARIIMEIVSYLE